ncbi:MAG TPA: caspase family protein [Ferruginibacter sp.]|jgi:hypothetical protein|nr:caspase family protein [Ferruginibacter sp.]
MPVTYALIIAIENYTHFRKVAFAIKDGQDLKDALTKIGLEEDDIKILSDKDATKNSIISELEILSKRATKDDRIIFFFAGHGTFIEDQNYIIPVDAYKNISLKGSCISISTILGYLKKSNCTKNILFLDCCHSGFEPGDTIRDANISFLADELKLQYRSEEYCCGFASSKSNETSISNGQLRNGVWTHFLIRALNGDAGEIYEDGILLSDRLQSYLNKNVKEFVHLNTTTKQDQTPTFFGNLTDRFIIADLNEIFAERESKRIVTDISFTNVTIFSNENGLIKLLPDFQKGYHKVPTSIYSGANSFVKGLGESLIKDEIEKISEEISQKLSYKRTQIEAYSDKGSGAIITPDFTYSMEICQSESDPGEYILIRQLESFSNSSIILEEAFNSIFSHHFDMLQFEFSNEIDIPNLIDLIQDLPRDSKISVKYVPSDLSRCTIFINELDYGIEVTSHTFSISSNIYTSPEKLLEAYKKTNTILLSNQNLKLLGE